MALIKVVQQITVQLQMFRLYKIVEHIIASQLVAYFGAYSAIDTGHISTSSL